MGFYNSGFEEEIAVVVVDGAGSIKNGGHEVSIYKASYPDNFQLLHQRFIPTYKKQEEVPDNPTSGIGMVCTVVLNTLVSILHLLANSWVLLLMVRTILKLNLSLLKTERLMSLYF